MPSCARLARAHRTTSSHDRGLDMNSGETLAGLLVQVSTIIGVHAAIWWPRKLKPGTAAARAFRAARIAAACLTLGFLLIIASTGLPFEGTPLQRLLLIASLGTAPLMPLSSVALSLERGRRVRALYSTYFTMVLTSALTWVCIVRALLLFANPYGIPYQLWQIACTLGALVLCATAVVALLEIYAALHQPRVLDEGSSAE